MQLRTENAELFATVSSLRSDLQAKLAEVDSKTAELAQQKKESEEALQSVETRYQGRDQQFFKLARDIQLKGFEICRQLVAKNLPNVDLVFLDEALAAGPSNAEGGAHVEEVEEVEGDEADLAEAEVAKVELVLDKENFTLEELLDEEDVIQECKALNSRLINFLRDRTQVEHLLRYIIEEPPEDAESKRIYKFPFIACEIFTCEIDVILKTLVENEELMDLLFSFLDPNRPHSALVAVYFSKVVICLVLRKSMPLMNYVQAHQDVLPQLVNLIGVTSIMEVLIRLVGSDEHIYPNSLEALQWLADSDLLEMIVDKLSPSSPPEVHANAAETLCAITRNAPSPLATKLSSTSYVTRIFGHALEDSHAKSALFHSLSVCISLLDPKKPIHYSSIYSFRSQHVYESRIHVNPKTVSAMLPKLGDLLMLLNVSSDKNVLPTTYGELRPPLGKHRLKVVEFIAVLLKTGNEAAEEDLISSGTIQRILDLFFEYPFNNALHHHVESIIFSCLESKNNAIVDHLFQQCNLVRKILRTDKNPTLSGDLNQPTIPVTGRQAPRAGNLGHITRIANKLVQLGNGDNRIQEHLQESSEWNAWHVSFLQELNMVENVYRWACGRPTTLQDRMRDSDEDDRHDIDYDVGTLANNISQAFRYTVYENDDAEEGHEALGRDDEDVYLDDESAEVVISSLRLADDQGSNLFTNSNWFAFQNDQLGDAPLSTSHSEKPDDISNLNGGGNDSSDDEVVVGEDEELVDAKISANEASSSDENNFTSNPQNGNETSPLSSTSKGESSSNGTLTSTDSSDRAVERAPKGVPSLFEEDVEFVGVELEGTEKAMEQALKEGIVGEAGPLKRNNNNVVPKFPEKDNSDDELAAMEFNNAKYWRVEQEVAVLE